MFQTVTSMDHTIADCELVAPDRYIHDISPLKTASMAPDRTSWYITNADYVFSGARPLHPWYHTMMTMTRIQWRRIVTFMASTIEDYVFSGVGPLGSVKNKTKMLSVVTHLHIIL